jgi:hypothetical protein
MNRRDALKSLCVLAGSALLPIALIDFEGEPRIYDHSLQAAGWSWDESGLMSRNGQSFFPMYAQDGSLMTGIHSGVFAAYYYRGNGVVECLTKTYPEIRDLMRMS